MFVQGAFYENDKSLQYITISGNIPGTTCSDSFSGTIFWNPNSPYSASDKCNVTGPFPAVRQYQIFGNTTIAGAGSTTCKGTITITPKNNLES